ncbi:MAG: PLP-dependent aminotransferase family protein [Desulfobacterales bacterium]
MKANGTDAPYRYLRLADEIEGQIREGVFRAGEKLPSIRKLKSVTGFSLTTVYQAFVELEGRGLVEPRLKSGFYVKPVLHRLLPPPRLRRHRAVPRRVSVSNIALSVVEAMGDPSMLRLGGTATAPELLPTRQLNAIVRSLSSRRMADLIATYENPAGNLALRREIAKRSIELMHRIDAEDVLVTNGCLEAVSLCLRAVARAGDAVVVESPTYPWFLQLIKDLNMYALEVPTDPGTGIALDSLMQAIDANDVKACLLVPNFNNPMGCLMPEEKKRSLVSFLNERKIPVIEDDIHGDLYFGRSRPGTLKAYDRRGLVLYCSSFSKTLAPGFRIGWVLAGRFSERVRRLKMNTSVSSPTLTQYVVAEFLKAGAYDRHLRRLRAALRNQASDVALAASRHLPEDTRITSPDGGLTLWVELNPAVDGLEVFHAAKAEGIAILPGSMCSGTKRFRNYIRLSFGLPWSEAVNRGIRRLGEIVKGLAACG